MIDFHTHILHRIDDGPRKLEESVSLLKNIYENGTDVAVLTSHFYPRDQERFDEFIDRRKRRYDELKLNCLGCSVPKLVLGAEVNIHTDFSKFDNIRELCIEGTDYMLLEMPAKKWEEWMFDCIHNLKLKGIKPIMAHIDRYLDFNKHDLEALDDLKPLYQVNADAFLIRGGMKKMLDLFYSDRLHVIGSDMHDGKIRKNNLPDAYIKIEEKFGEEFVSMIENNGDAILTGNEVKRNVKLPKIKKRGFLF